MTFARIIQHSFASIILAGYMLAGSAVLAQTAAQGSAPSSGPAMIVGDDDIPIFHPAALPKRFRPDPDMNGPNITGSGKLRLSVSLRDLQNAGWTSDKTIRINLVLGISANGRVTSCDIASSYVMERSERLEKTCTMIREKARYIWDRPNAAPRRGYLHMEVEWLFPEFDENMTLMPQGQGIEVLVDLNECLTARTPMSVKQAKQLCEIVKTLLNKRDGVGTNGVALTRENYSVTVWLRSRSVKILPKARWSESISFNSWNYYYPPAPISPTIPRLDSAGYIIVRPTDAEFPTKLLNKNLASTVTADVTIGADGRVIDCWMVQSTGPLLLDEATCPLLKKRGRFDAEDEDKKLPPLSALRTEVNWVTPQPK